MKMTEKTISEQIEALLTAFTLKYPHCRPVIYIDPWKHLAWQDEVDAPKSAFEEGRYFFAIEYKGKDVRLQVAQIYPTIAIGSEI